MGCGGHLFSGDYRMTLRDGPALKAQGAATLDAPLPKH